MEFKHYSVLLHETIDNLDIKPDGIYVDGTLGGGGHSLEILKHLGPGGRLIGIDQDEDALKAASERLSEYKDRTTFIHTNYENMVQEVHKLGINHVDGIVLDLGVSSFQLDNAKRGFSYMQEDAPLDMRMDQSSSKTARDIVNGYSENELTRIIRDYGEDKFARSIARHIVQAREVRPLETAGDLNRAIETAIPMKARKTGGHPSKRTYQAIRVELNRELQVLEDSLDGMIDLLNEGGRLCVITFQSLEDHIVKVNFRRNENPRICPPEFPVCVCVKKSTGYTLQRKPILPSKKELEENSRSKSAHLRVFVRETSKDSTPSGHVSKGSR